MPSEAAVFIVADALVASGEQPSLRMVLEKLATGGSSREICKHLRAWREKRGDDSGLELTDIPTEIEDAEAGSPRKVGPLTQVVSQSDGFRAEEFWDCVMREIFEILPVAGTMAPDEIMQALRVETFRTAALHDEPLTPSSLRKKMEVRIAHGRYFERSEEGRYARRAG
jgi:hypothetical protein